MDILQEQYLAEEGKVEVVVADSENLVRETQHQRRLRPPSNTHNWKRKKSRGHAGDPSSQCTTMVDPRTDSLHPTSPHHRYLHSSQVLAPHHLSTEAAPSSRYPRRHVAESQARDSRRHVAESVIHDSRRHVAESGARESRRHVAESGARESRRHVSKSDIHDSRRNAAESDTQYPRRHAAGSGISHSRRHIAESDTRDPIQRMGEFGTHDSQRHRGELSTHDPRQHMADSGTRELVCDVTEARAGGVTPQRESRRPHHPPPGRRPRHPPPVRKDLIGPPTNFQHVTHVGFDNTCSQDTEEPQLDPHSKSSILEEQQMLDTRTMDFSYNSRNDCEDQQENPCWSDGDGNTERQELKRENQRWSRPDSDQQMNQPWSRPDNDQQKNQPWSRPDSDQQMNQPWSRPDNDQQKNQPWSRPDSDQEKNQRWFRPNGSKDQQEVQWKNQHRSKPDTVDDATASLPQPRTVISKAMIGPPTDFQHVLHVGPDADDLELQQLMKMANLNQGRGSRGRTPESMECLEELEYKAARPDPSTHVPTPPPFRATDHEPSRDPQVAASESRTPWQRNARPSEKYLLELQDSPPGGELEMSSVLQPGTSPTLCLPKPRPGPPHAGVRKDLIGPPTNFQHVVHVGLHTPVQSSEEQQQQEQQEQEQQEQEQQEQEQQQQQQQEQQQEQETPNTVSVEDQYRPDLETRAAMSDFVDGEREQQQQQQRQEQRQEQQRQEEEQQQQEQMELVAHWEPSPWSTTNTTSDSPPPLPPPTAEFSKDMIGGLTSFPPSSHVGHHNVGQKLQHIPKQTSSSRRAPALRTRKSVPDLFERRETQREVKDLHQQDVKYWGKVATMRTRAPSPRLRKDMIGPPINFQHVKHVGFNSTEAEVTNDHLNDPSSAQKPELDIESRIQDSGGDQEEGQWENQHCFTNWGQQEVSWQNKRWSTSDWVQEVPWQNQRWSTPRSLEDAASRIPPLSFGLSKDMIGPPTNFQHIYHLDRDALHLDRDALHLDRDTLHHHLDRDALHQHLDRDALHHHLDRDALHHHLDRDALHHHLANNPTKGSTRSTTQSVQQTPPSKKGQEDDRAAHQLPACRARRHEHVVAGGRPPPPAVV